MKKDNRVFKQCKSYISECIVFHNEVQINNKSKYSLFSSLFLMYVLGNCSLAHFHKLCTKSKKLDKIFNVVKIKVKVKNYGKNK